MRSVASISVFLLLLILLAAPGRASAQVNIAIGDGSEFACVISENLALVLRSTKRGQKELTTSQAIKLVRRQLRRSKIKTKALGLLRKGVAKAQKRTLTKRIVKLREVIRQKKLELQQLEECADGSLANATPTPTATVAASPTANIEPSPLPTESPTVVPSPTATATFTPTATATFTPTATPTCQVAPADPGFNDPLTIPLNTTLSSTEFVSFPTGDSQDRVAYSIPGVFTSARLTVSAACFGSNTEHISFTTGGSTYACGDTVIDKLVTSDSDTGSIVIEATGGDCTYVQWVLTGTAVEQ